MSRVLIWKRIIPGSEYDIYRGVGLRQEYTWRTSFNVGNRLWFQGIMSAIDTGENQYEFLNDEMTADMMNSEYDFIILPMANIFNSKFRHHLEEQTFLKIKIPVYVIACGAQAENYDALDSLVKDIGELSKRFIGSVYNTGGEFGLRGAFTKEFFDRLGYPAAVVTGCPSMYQLGEDFLATNRNSQMEPTNPVFNGDILAIKKLMEHYSESIFIDQDALWKELYFEHDHTSTFRDDLRFYCNYGSYAAELLGQDRVRLIPDMYNWSIFLKKSGFDYSFGSRIHGNIIAILSGIPSTVVAIDTRTQEMAEFFNIPYVKYVPGHQFTPEEIVELYSCADYTKFNETYKKKYHVYEQFLVQHGIVSHVNQNNPFLDERKAYVAPLQAVNVHYYKDMSQRFRRNKVLLDCAAMAVTIKNKLT